MIFQYFASLCIFAALVEGQTVPTPPDLSLLVLNKCPTGISVYQNGQQDNILRPGTNYTMRVSKQWSGFIYTDANGGTQSGAGSAMASFYGEVDYYWIVKDPALFNTGLSIVPMCNPGFEFCVEAKCLWAGCNTAFSLSPAVFPAPVGVAPPTPLYACPGASVGYIITFCPDGYFPPSKRTVTLRPNGDKTRCLDVKGGRLDAGNTVQIYFCNGSRAQRWLVPTADQPQLRLEGTDLCLRPKKSSLTAELAFCNETLPMWELADNSRLVWGGKESSSRVCLESNKESSVGFRECSEDGSSQTWTASGDGYYYDF